MKLRLYKASNGDVLVKDGNTMYRLDKNSSGNYMVKSCHTSIAEKDMTELSDLELLITHGISKHQDDDEEIKKIREAIMVTANRIAWFKS